jgi:Uma2 family endonuclease
LVTQVGERAVVRVQNPVNLDSRTELQPDVMLLKWRDYSQGHPRPEDVLLLVEVSDTTVDSDRGVKLPLYARSGVREVWIVDLPARSVETYSEPEGDSYAKTGLVGLDGELSPAALGGVALSVREILSIGTRTQ